MQNIAKLTNVEAIKTELAIESLENALELIKGLAETAKPSYNANRAKLLVPQIRAIVEAVRELRNEI